VRVASVDVGTNTVRFLVAEDKGIGKSSDVIYRGHYITRLGEGIGGFVNRRGYLKGDSIKRTVDALLDFRKIWQSLGVSKYRAVATSAAREAENSNEFIGKAKRIGVKVDIISDEEEARLSLRGIRNAIDIGSGQTIVFDIGGGSTEFVHAVDGKLKKIVGTDIGVVRLRESFIESYPPKAEEIAKLSNFLDKHLKMVYNQIEKSGIVPMLVGTAGTATSIAAMDLGISDYDPALIDGYKITSSKLGDIIDSMAALSEREILEKYPILEGGREDVILPGMMIVRSILKVFNDSEFTVSDSGLLEGIVEGLIENNR
jgi:exopolyphosphatase/guanosine-5'-triphosphate,3'-diphosphate pyrophosphatase